MLKKIQKELNRIEKKIFRSSPKDKEIEQLKYAVENLPYEISDKISKKINDVSIPIIKTIDETLDKIISDKCSIARFGDGEFNIMNGGRIRLASAPQ